MKLKYLLISGILSISLAFTGCEIASFPEIQEEPVNGTEHSYNVMEKKNDRGDEAASEGNMKNSMMLLDMLYSSKGGNVILSPMSLNMALGMIDNGAAGSTKDALDSFLGTDDFNATVKAVMDKYGTDSGAADNTGSPADGSGSGPVMEVADSVWVSDDRKINSGFRSTVEGIYKAEVDNIDTDDPEGTSERINSWCSNRTRGLIPEIITPSQITQDTSMVLVNTVYFNSSWDNEWGVKEGSFTGKDGNMQTLDVICNEADRYFEDNEATAFSAGYKNGMEFIGILPKEKDFNVSDIDIEKLLASDRSSDYDIIYAEMPRLKFDTDNRILKNSLSSLGLSVIFDSAHAEFPALVEQAPGEVTYVSDIIQKCTIDLDEYGTEASAATAAIMNTFGAAVPDHEPKIVEVILDRPFLFAIRDPGSGQLAFLGRVDAP